jgi:hypothetical protein
MSVRVLTIPILMLASFCAGAHGAPVAEPWNTQHADPVSAVAAAQLSGWYATSETAQDSIEIRDIRQDLIRRITRDELEVLLPWMTLDQGNDGPRALAWTDSGRALFIVVCDDAPSPDGLGPDAVVRYDTTTDELSVFSRTDIGGADGEAPAVLHHEGQLWLSTQAGPVHIYDARRNVTSGSLQSTWSLPSGDPVLGLAVARELNLLFAVSDAQLYRIELTQAAITPEFVGPVDNARAVAYSDHLGAPSQEGAFVLGNSGITHVPRFQATGLLAYAPTQYLGLTSVPNDLAATPCGRLLQGTSTGAQIIRDDADTRLDFEAWVRDEFQQVITYAEGLLAPDGEPSGWVIDADVAAGGSRFHPPSPDGAAWLIMLEIAKDHLAGDQASAGTVRSILRRYAGLMPDGIAPTVTADGIMHHWYDPWTGASAPGWSDEYATLSTMLIVMAADRARRFYQDDAQIVEAADVIIGRISNWDSYIQPGTNAMYFRAAATGGPDFGTASAPYNEGVLFIEQAAAYANASNALGAWLDRASLPEAEYVNGLPVTTNWPGNHLPAFVSLYPYIAQNATRGSGNWSRHLENLLASHGAWVDDNAPRFMTVFSAGTTKPEWGGYNADSLSNHPGDVTTFPALMAFSTTGRTAPSVGAYHAYRKGARQSFETGALLLYRRSDIDPGYTPGDAGLPDVVIGALGLAELIRSGTADAVLAIPYQPECPADLAPPRGNLNFFDVSIFLSAFNSANPTADLARPFGEFNFFDVSAYLSAFANGCP